MIYPVKRLFARPTVLAVLGGLATLFLVFCSIFYNIHQTEALSMASIAPNSGPSTGGQAVQINLGNDLYRRVDGLNFTNPQGTNASPATPNQYINTGINQTGNVKIELSFKLADGTTCTNTGDSTGTPNMRIFGSWQGWNTQTLYLARYSGTDADTANHQCAFGIRRGASITETDNGTVLPMGDNAFDTNVHAWTLNGNTTQPTGSWDDIPLDNPSATLPNANPYPMYLGTIDNQGSALGGNGLSGTVYSLKIWQNDTLVRDMIPVCNTAMTSCGLQDKVTQTFYGNSGSGTITGGNFLDNEVQSVTFDGAAATNVNSPSAYVVQATTPAHATASVDVVAVVNGQRATLARGYNYYQTVTAVNPDLGPTTGGTGFGTTYNASGQITITGDGFIKPSSKLRDYIIDNAITGWVNPAFSSATNSDAYGGTITNIGTIYSDGSGTHSAYKAFDRVRTGTSGNWVVTVNKNPDAIATVTYTLPAGKYVNLKSIEMVNGANSPIRKIEFFAGGYTELSITGAFNTTSSSSFVPYNISPTAANADLWTNQITARVYPPAYAYTDYVAVQELVYSGDVIDLNGQMDSFPTYFHLADYTNTPASAVSIGGTPCASFTLVSNTQITCVPAAHVKGLYDVVVTVDGDTSLTPVSNSASDDYDYIDPMVITGVSPGVGAEAGKESVTITGNNFLSTHRPGASQPPTITFDPGGTPVDCSLTSYTDTQIICTTSAHSPGLVSVKVDNGLQTYTMNANPAANGGPVMSGNQSIGGYLYYEIHLKLSLSDLVFSVPPGGSNYGYTVANVDTNNPGGYELTLESDGSDLVCESYTIPSIASDGALSIAADKHGAWGWNVVEPAAMGGSWIGTVPMVPSAWQTIPVDMSAVIANPIAPSAADGDNYGVYFGVTADWVQPACNGYKQNLTITVVPKQN
ncbi:MAG: IPT/TIG domain-containing protein [Candidatus Nomurabacteria bacterium]|jgi:hypothetical protein|nr:IPT/TIG domain-containing protein [Candidatus Nomurabacteria bacterium]